MTVKWKPRGGRNQLYALWDDALGDLLAHLKLKRATLNELPPEKPTGRALTGETYALWVSAVDEFQAEGTALCDAVRPALSDGPSSHRAVEARGHQRYGRALLR